MININFLNINNSKLIGRLLPFWLRGKKISLLLLSLLSPLVSLHNNFKAWALEHFIIAHITAQESSIEWYITYKLNRHFVNKEDKFQVICGVGTPENIIFRNEEFHQIENYTAPIFYNDEEEYQNNEMVIYYKNEKIEATIVANVYAPKIIETINYDKSDYERDIKAIISRFMTNFRKYNIIIEE